MLQEAPTSSLGFAHRHAASSVGNQLSIMQCLITITNGSEVSDIVLADHLRPMAR